MIGDLSVTNFVLLAVFSFGFMAIVVYLVADATDPRRTVENEQDESREEAAFGSQWSGITTQDDQAFLLDSPDERDEFLARHGVGRRQ